MVKEHYSISFLDQHAAAADEEEEEEKVSQPIEEEQKAPSGQDLLNWSTSLAGGGMRKRQKE